MQPPQVPERLPKQHPAAGGHAVMHASRSCHVNLWILPGAAIALILPLAFAAQAKPGRLQEVLSQMDASSKNFRSAEADIRKEHFEKLVDDTTTDTGTVFFLRNGNSMQLGAKFNPPDAKTLEYKDGKGRLYTAGTNHIDEFSASGANQAKFETFITLGFGGTGADLTKQWNVSDLGTEQMDDSGKPVSVEKLDLLPKDPGVRNTYAHVTIWIDPVRDVTLKQEFFAPRGDTDTAVYSNIRLNQPIDLKAFAIKCQGKC
jgi:outer membrane lipoprotein-sorting protein